MPAMFFLMARKDAYAPDDALICYGKESARPPMPFAISPARRCTRAAMRAQDARYYFI